MQHLGEAEVKKLDYRFVVVRVASEEDVFGLEIAVDDALLVSLAEGAAELGEDGVHGAVGEAPLGLGAELVQERAPLEKLHDEGDEIGAVVVLGLSEVDDVDEQAPWALKKTDSERMKAVLQTLFIALHDLAIAIQPVIPAKAAALLDQLGIPRDERSFAALADSDWFNRLVASGFTVAPPTPLFPRRELPADEASD